MSYELTGKIIDIQPTKQVSDRFRKREFVVEKTEAGSTSTFVDYIKFQLTQDRCDLINDGMLGTVVTVSFRIRGNRWERDGMVNYFTNLDAWKIEAGRQEASYSQEPQNNSYDNIPDYISTTEEESDDLPF